jgi:Flp pilus assembly protein TadG
MPTPTRLRDETGAALAEFALVLPLVLAIFLGMLDFGRAINYWIDGTHIANVTARYAAVNKNPGAAAGKTLQQFMAEQGTTKELREGSSQVTEELKVCVTYPEGAAVGNPVEVVVTARYQWLGFITDYAELAPSTVLRGKALMRLEARQTNVTAGCWPA